MSTTSFAARDAYVEGCEAKLTKSHVAFLDLLVAGDAEAALSALGAHLNAWLRDVLVLATTAFTNGLIGVPAAPGRNARCWTCWTGFLRATAMIGGSQPITGWRCRRIASEMPPVQ